MKLQLVGKIDLEGIRISDKLKFINYKLTQSIFEVVIAQPSIKRRR